MAASSVAQHQAPATTRWRVNRDSLAFGPLLVLAGVLVVVPLAAVLYGSLCTGSPGAADATFTVEHWQAVYTSPVYHTAFLNTLAIALLVTLFASSIGIVLAWLLVRTDTPGARWLDVAVIVPQFFAPLTSALAWIVLASPRTGLFNVLLQRAGLAEGPVFNIFTLAGIVWVMSLGFVPYAYLNFAPAMRALDPAMEEASATAGAGLWTTLRRVSLPLILPSLFSGAFLIFVLSMEAFAVPALLGGPVRYYNLPYLVYLNTVRIPANYSMAAAAGTVLLWLAVIAAYLYQRLLDRANRYVTVTGKGYRPARTKLGRWRYLALGFCLAYFGAAVIVPYSGLLLVSSMRFITPRITPELFTLGNYQQILAAPEALRASWNTLILVTSGPTLGVLLGLLLSFALLRLDIPGRRLINYLINLPIAIPAMVLGIGVLWAYAYIPLPIYGTLLALIVGYQTRYLIYPVRSATNGLVQIHRELEESARVAGAATGRLIRDIVAPLLVPSLLAGWLFMFVLIVREIDLTIMLYSPATQPISLLMWEYTDNGQYTAAAALGIVQALFILVALLVVRRLLRGQTIASA